MTDDKKQIAILGPGAIGGFLAALFSRSGHDVTCIAKPGVLYADGIRLTSGVFGNVEARPRFVTALDSAPDILFVTVKAPDLPDAVKAIPKNLIENTVIIPLLNGIEHVEFLREYFGYRVAVGMIGALEAKSEKPGYIVHASPQVPRVEIASKDVSAERLQGIVRLVREAGLRSEVLDLEAEVIWRKLVRLSAIAATTAVAQKPVGFVRSDPEWRKLLEGCVHEAAAVAEKDGVMISSEEVMRQIEALPADLRTSLQRDVARGVTGERDAIVGAIIRRAKKYGISSPVFEKLWRAGFELTSIERSEFWPDSRSEE